MHLEAGRPIAFINGKFAKKLNIIEGSRIEISHKGTKLILSVNIIKKLLSEKEISLSEEAISNFKIKKGEKIEISVALEPRSTRFILKKVNNLELSKKEIHVIIEDIVNNALNEAEIAYFVTGVYHNGMSVKEIIYLTEAMAHTGQILKWKEKKIADKHSIGGIPGNRTTPLVVAICAAAGITIPKTSSRAITTAAATADVMEAVTNISLSVYDLQKVVRKTNACLAWGGSLGLAPADDKLIRVEKMLNLDPEPQLIASILSKKIATGSKFILLDVPYGKGAKVSFAQAKKLKQHFLKISNHFKLNLKVVLTPGFQPIGNAVGPVLEMIDVYKILKRKHGRPLDLEKKSILLASHLLEMTKKAKKGKGKEMAEKILDSGRALKKFEEIISAQGKKKKTLKLAKFKHNILGKHSGKVKSTDNKLINHLARILGCPTDKAAGLYLYKHVNDKIKKGEKLLTLYSESKKKLNAGIKFYRQTRPIILS